MPKNFVIDQSLVNRKIELIAYFPNSILIRIYLQLCAPTYVELLVFKQIINFFFGRMKKNFHIFKHRLAAC